MAHWLNNQLKTLGVDTRLVDLGTHVMDEQELPLPPAILGSIGNDPKKKTVLIYGHFDVQPVSIVWSVSSRCPIYERFRERLAKTRLRICCLQ